MPRIAQSLAMGVGVAGALVDVSADVNLSEGVKYSWGRKSQFFDADPGRFSFTLDNPSGKYTPENRAGGLVTTVTEGMQVSWSLGGRLRVGRIVSIEPTFPSGEALWSKVDITAEDMLGDAGRREFALPLTSAMVLGSTPYLYWPLNDTVGSVAAAETSGRNQPTFGALRTTDVFGQAGFAALGTDTQLLCSMAVGQSLPSAPAIFSSLSAVAGSFTTIDYSASSMGVWGVWMTPIDANSDCLITVSLNGLTAANSPLSFGIKQNFGPTFFMDNGATADFFSTVPATFGVPRYLQIVVTYTGSTAISYEFFIDGVSQVSQAFVPFSGPAGLSTNFNRTPSKVGILNNSGSVRIAHLSHTATPVSEWLFDTGTEAAAFRLIDEAIPQVTLAALPATLSPVRIRPPEATSGLDALNEIAKTEQGSIYSSVTGTLLAPVELLTVRERTRPVSVTAQWNVQDEISGSPDFVRDLAHMAATVTAEGPTTSVMFTDPTLVGRAGSANTRESALFVEQPDLLMFAQDRSLRGANVQLRIASVTVDAMTTPTDRSVALLALTPGDRHQFTGLPSTQLGFSTWDGWLLGASETHSVGEHAFTLYFQPVLPNQAVLDTNLFMADGNVTLPVAIDGAVTSFTLASTNGLLTTTEVPFSLLINAEQVTVTAVSGAASPQTVTVVRGQGGTTAAAHTTVAVVEVIPASLYAF